MRRYLVLNIVLAIIFTLSTFGAAAQANVTEDIFKAYDNVTRSPPIATSPIVYGNVTLTASEYQLGPFTISFDPGRPYKSVRGTVPLRLLGPDGKTWYTHYVLFCYSDRDGTMIDTLIQLNKFDLPEFNLNGEFPTKAVYTDLISWKVDPNTAYVVQRAIDGKPGAVGWGYLPTTKTQVYSINWYISPTSVAHVEVWDEQEAGHILSSIHIVEPVNMNISGINQEGTASNVAQSGESPSYGSWAGYGF